jgi:hypothetical protein
MAPRRVSENRATPSWVGWCRRFIGDVLGWVFFIVYGVISLLGVAIVFGLGMNLVTAKGRTGGVVIGVGVPILLIILWASAFILNRSGFSRKWIFWRSTHEAPIGEALFAAAIAWVYFTVFFSGLSCILYRNGLVGTIHPVKSGSLMLMGVFSYSWQLGNALALSIPQTWGWTYGNGFSGDTSRVLLLAYELVIILPVLHVVARGVRRAH